MHTAILIVKKRGFLMLEVALSVVLLLLVIRPFMSITCQIAQQSHTAKISFSRAQTGPVKQKASVRFILTATKRLPQKALERVVVHV